MAQFNRSWTYQWCRKDWPKVENRCPHSRKKMFEKGLEGFNDFSSKFWVLVCNLFLHFVILPLTVGPCKWIPMLLFLFRSTTSRSLEMAPSLMKKRHKSKECWSRPLALRMCTSVKVQLIVRHLFTSISSFSMFLRNVYPYLVVS